MLLALHVWHAGVCLVLLGLLVTLRLLDSSVHHDIIPTLQLHGLPAAHAIAPIPDRSVLAAASISVHPNEAAQPSQQQRQLGGEQEEREERVQETVAGGQSESREGEAREAGEGAGEERVAASAIAAAAATTTAAAPVDEPATQGQAQRGSSSSSSSSAERVLFSPSSSSFSGLPSSSSSLSLASVTSRSSPSSSSSSPPLSLSSPYAAPSIGSPADGYLLSLPVSGFGNQVLGYAKAITVANFYNRSLVVAPLLSSHLMDPHRTAFYNIRGGASEEGLMTVRFNLTRVLQYEKYYRFAYIEPSAGVRPLVMLSDFIRRYGAEHVCWDGFPTADTPPFLNTNATVLCVGRAYRLKLPKMRNQHFTPIHQWLVFDQALVHDAQRWLSSQRGLNASSYACVHYRAGDFQRYLKERYVDLSGLIGVMDAAGRPLTNNTVVVTNTNEGNELEMLRMLGWRSVNASALRVPVELPILREMKRLFMEQLICQQAPVFVGCRYSTFSGIITTMRHCSYDNEHCFNYCWKE